MERAYLEVALEAARRAGEVLVARLWDERTVEMKGYRDPVTEVDAAAEETIVSILREYFPDHAILAEEGGEREAVSPYLWMVDPLDGTTNYSRRNPMFTVSVALTREDQCLVGVVHDPLRDQTFSAQRDGGASLNGRRLRASQVEDISDALVGLDWAHADDARQDVLRRLSALAPRCRTIRALGSAALALTYVGAGWLDVYFATGLYPWDSAAASLIVTEAGGGITDWEGKPWQLGQPTLLATGGGVHAQVLEIWGDEGD